MYCRMTGAIPLALATLLTPFAARAAASFTDVWFPNGNVEFHIADDAEDARDTITDTMTYMAEHTPLEIVESATESGADLHFEATWVAPNGGGYTYAYWDEIRDDDNQKIRFDPNH